MHRSSELLEIIRAFSKAPKPTGYRPIDGALIVRLLGLDADLKEAWPSKALLAEEQGVEERLIERSIKRLAAWKWISVRSGKKSRTANRYTVLVANLPLGSFTPKKISDDGMKLATDYLRTMRVIAMKSPDRARYNYLPSESDSPSALKKRTAFLSRTARWIERLIAEHSDGVIGVTQMLNFTILNFSATFEKGISQVWKERRHIRNAMYNADLQLMRLAAEQEMREARRLSALARSRYQTERKQILNNQPLLGQTGTEHELVALKKTYEAATKERDRQQSIRLHEQQRRRDEEIDAAIIGA